jgi:hypothetical protein
VLKDAIALSSEFQYQLPSFDMEQYKKIIQEFVEML